MKKLLYLSMFLWLVLTGCTQEKKEFTVLQWNIWQEGTMVPGGYEAIVDEIIRLRPDFVTLSEVRNYNNTNFTARLTRSLKEKLIIPSIHTIPVYLAAIRLPTH